MMSGYFKQLEQCNHILLSCLLTTYKFNMNIWCCLKRCVLVGFVQKRNGYSMFDQNLIYRSRYHTLDIWVKDTKLLTTSNYIQFRLITFSQTENIFGKTFVNTLIFRDGVCYCKWWSTYRRTTVFGRICHFNLSCDTIFSGFPINTSSCWCSTNNTI